MTPPADPAHRLESFRDRPAGFVPRVPRALTTTAAEAMLPEAPWYERLGEPVLSNRVQSWAKRGLDVTLTVLALPILLLVLGLLAVAVWLDSPGNPFYSQLRTGCGGRRFRMFKLRTMVANADELKERYAHLNELSPPDFKITDDPRVTKVGRFLRKTSLDELPQLLNVLKGDMSLVGPRPTSFSADTYSLWHTARLEVRPGLTGLWQISGRNELDFDDRLRLDIAYIRNRSLALDLLLILKTFGAVVSGRGAS